MGKEDRKEQVLRLLGESGLALPPAVIFRNAKLRGATFERRSVNNYLAELLEEGRVRKVDPSRMGDGELSEIDSGDKGYFIITDKGVESLE